VDFIVSNVLWFLAAAVVFALVAIVLQVRNICKVTKMEYYNFEKQARGMILGFIPVAICGLGAAACFVLFIIGVIGYFVK
jgi:hypothetical protein